MTPDLANLTEHDLDIATRTIVAEARGETWAGKVAVAHVLLNRWARPGWWSRAEDTVRDDSLAAVCVDPKQFSGWNLADPNLRYVAILPPTHPVYLECRAALLAALLGREPDPTGGATHYHAAGVTPPWADGVEPSAVIWNHVFYAGVG